ncbi:uncharacterized protein LOC111393094 [Olea europaea var. sylvestris]|uniref:uncharacterized protein LOC111393094 n=1 Tax=Olea europaea var. sylvestris TaxID=158386 RepID=UPI000C1D335A|nr:uncharacterized protein LOC111393094 [Olea europaea var. sylvestris]
MTVDIKESTLYVEKAHKLWVDLEQHLAQQYAPKIYEIKQGIAALMQGQDTERDWVMKFLMGLNDSYKGLKAQILLIKPFPKLNEVYSLIQLEEKRRKISSDTHVYERMALVSRTVMREAVKRNTGPLKNNCFKIHGYPLSHKFYSKSQVNFTCTNQNTSSMGSVQEQTGDKSQVTLTQEEYTQLMALIKPSINQPHSSSANHVQGLNSLSPKHTNLSKISCTYTCSSTHISESSTTIPWVVDTGATDHMVCTMPFLTIIKSKISPPVALPNGAIALATHIGNVKITENLFLRDVLCVPSFSFNLISASKLAQGSNCCLIVSSNLCYVQDLTTWKTISLGKVSKGLYHLVPREVSPTILDQNMPRLVNKAALSVSANDSQENFDLWHFRLGHLSDSRMDLTDLRPKTKHT